jgi:antitoxin CptB
MATEEEYKRICWASRRGMLELDLIMVPFVEQRFRDLPEIDQKRFTDLLESEDNDLFAWFLGRQKPEDPELADIVQQVIDHARAH